MAKENGRGFVNIELSHRQRWLRTGALGALCAVLAATPLAAEEPGYVRDYGDAQFRPLNPAMSPGAQVAVLWGDPDTGPSAVLFKMGKGATPLHTHSSTYHLTVIEGTMKHWTAGESEAQARALGPGGYWRIEGGRPHADSCLSEQCVAFIKWDGRRDGKLLE